MVKVYVKGSKNPVWQYKKWGKCLRRKLRELANEKSLSRVWLHLVIPGESYWYEVSFNTNGYVWESIHVKQTEWSK